MQQQEEASLASEVLREGDAILALSREPSRPLAEGGGGSSSLINGERAAEAAAAALTVDVGVTTGKPHRSLAAGQVDRVVMEALPEGMHLSRDARVAFQKSATITLLYLACLADEERSAKLKGKKRSTLSVQDMHDALAAAGMAHLLPLMQTTSSKRGRE